MIWIPVGRNLAEYFTGVCVKDCTNPVSSNGLEEYKENRKYLLTKLSIYECMHLCEMWTDQHGTSVGQRKNLSPRRESNSWPPEHRAGALSTELRELMESIDIYLSSYVTGVLHTSRISTVWPDVESRKSMTAWTFPVLNAWKSGQ